MKPSVKAYQPVSESGIYAEFFEEDLTEFRENWRHTISAVRGFHSANFTLKQNFPDLQNWFNEGLMRRIVFENSEGVPVWEGFVNRMEFVYGSKKSSISMDNVRNLVYMIYTPVIIVNDQIVETVPTVYIAQDLESQLRYGVKAEVVNGGARTQEEAEDWAKTILKFYSVPRETDMPILLNQGSEPSLVISCLGYSYALDWIPYISSDNTFIRAHEVIQEVLRYYNTFNPGWFDQTFDWMDFNTRFQQRGYDGYKGCWEVISEVIGNGGPAGTRWVGGIYQDRRMVYKQAEDLEGLYGSESFLVRTISGDDLLIYDSLVGSEVNFWDVTPDRILRTVDDVGLDTEEYIEEVTFAEPYELQIVGGGDERLKTFLAQKGWTI